MALWSAAITIWLWRRSLMALWSAACDTCELMLPGYLNQSLRTSATRGQVIVIAYIVMAYAIAQDFGHARAGYSYGLCSYGLYDRSELRPHEGRCGGNAACLAADWVPCCMAWRGVAWSRAMGVARSGVARRGAVSARHAVVWRSMARRPVAHGVMSCLLVSCCVMSSAPRLHA